MYNEIAVIYLYTMDYNFHPKHHNLYLATELYALMHLRQRYLGTIIEYNDREHVHIYLEINSHATNVLKILITID